ncbi:hypothetical protein N9499_01485 [Octadecabacter sp.]|nr:hypothetical protein [Octadecabacter sp.]
MTYDLNSTGQDHLGQLSINDLLPERPAIVGEFSPAYEAFKQMTVADLAPMSQYEYIQALQLVDLNWSIMQIKASAREELSSATETKVRELLKQKLRRVAEDAFDLEYDQFIEAGGDEDEFEGRIDPQQIEGDVTALMAGLTSADHTAREAATARAISLGVDPRLVLSGQNLNSREYRRHGEALPDLEKRVRLLLAEYRELQRARPIEVAHTAAE